MKRPTNTLILGLADDFGDVPSIDDCYDPQSRFHVKKIILSTINLMYLLK